MRAMVVTTIALSVLVGSACRRPASRSSTAELTFDRDIAPIVHARCSPCHRPGQIGPFSLLTYEDVRGRARQIADVVSRRVMPPWLPDAGEFPLVNARRLSAAEIERIVEWVKSGSAEGADVPQHTPEFPHGEWQLGTPDLILELPEPYRLEHAAEDVFRNFVLSVPLSAPRFVRGMELQPGNTHVVHHITIGVDTTSGSRDLERDDPQPGFDGAMFAEGAHSPDNHALGWTPGMTPAMEAAPWKLEPNTDLILQLHMIPPPAGEIATVRPRVGLFFTDAAPDRQTVDFKLGSKTIDIPPGAANHVIEDSFKLPIDLQLLGIYPHAHYLGKELLATVTLPDGTTKPLIAIHDWNFRWQDQYRFASPVALPRGSVIAMRYTYDNSAGNPRNPSRPPRRVRYGPLASDEMGDLWLRVLPATASDAAVLAATYQAIERAKNVTAAEANVREAPRDAARHNVLGVRYLEDRRLEAAQRAFETAIRLAPNDAEALHNLGQCLRVQGQSAVALAPLERAARVAPGNAQIRTSLADVLEDLGRTEAAISQLRRAVALDPRFADAHNNLGAALAAQGKIDEAIGHFEAAVRLRPGDADAARNLDQARAVQAAAGTKLP